MHPVRFQIIFKCKFISRIILFFACFFIIVYSCAASIPWVSYPSANNTLYGVYHFRKSFVLEDIPQKLVIHVSADNRYNLFVNGTRVCYGPAKGDLQTYKYDVIDIAPFLKKGKNVLASLVYNGGKDKPLAFLSAQTAFMLRAENQEYNWINTNETWKTHKNQAYNVISYQELIFENRWFYGFYACGGGDDVDASKYPWGWELIDFDDSDWLAAEELIFEEEPWNLVPRNIAFLDNHLEYPAKIRLAEGASISAGDWNGDKKLTIPANTSAKILIDFDVFTMGYPELTVSRGTGGKIQVKYAEALYKDVNLKAHRDSVNGLKMFGVWDVFRPDGEKRTFRPLWKRAFRYVQFVIETKDEPIEIISFKNEYSGYPYPEMATFESNNDTLNEIFEMCLRTFRMCSGETYYDTPYYEQLSYGGDNRPIAAISMYNTTDDRLLKEALRLYSQGQTKETGLIKTAYPSRFDFDNGTWSLLWIQTLYDYYLMRGDADYTSEFTGNIEEILNFFERHLDEQSGLVGTVKNKNSTDWSIHAGRVLKHDSNGEIKQSALLSMYYAYTLDCASSLFKDLSLTEKSRGFEKISDRIKRSLYAKCWDKKRELFKDYPDSLMFSQQTNILAILCDAVPITEQKLLLDKILNYKDFDEVSSSYFSFFLFKAMQKTGREDLILDNLNFWYNFIELGHNTCGETGFASHDRSDCHAWSAHPVYFLLNSICGIKPANIGFKNVTISPHPGNLSNIKASIPHPNGCIKIEYKIRDNNITGTIILPQGLSGKFEYGGKVIALKNGINKID